MKNLLTNATALVLLLPIIVKAQKLPNIQMVSLCAPADVKVDGKTMEWGDKFQAYNKSIEAFYTIANDDTNLYLTIKATKNEIAEKIIRGGVTLIVNHTVKKIDLSPISITFPVLRGGDMAGTANMFTQRSYKQQDGVEVSVKQLNDYFEAKSKLIAVTGIEAVTNKEISIYNEFDIKAAVLFDDKNALTYELAVPLKYLNLPHNGAEAFSYHIKVNEEPTALASHADGGAPPPPIPIGSLGTTDFWGVYTLAKK